MTPLSAGWHTNSIAGAFRRNILSPQARERRPAPPGRSTRRAHRGVSPPRHAGRATRCPGGTSGPLGRVPAREGPEPAALGGTGGRVLHRLPVAAVIVEPALAGARVARDVAAAVVLAGGGDAVALDPAGRQSVRRRLGGHDGPGEGTRHVEQPGPVHPQPPPGDRTESRRAS